MQIINPPSTGGAGVSVLPPKSANWVSTLYPGIIGGSLAASAMVANRAILYPIFIGANCTITPMLTINTGLAGNIVVAIYNSDANGLPSTLAKTFTIVNTAVAGTKTLDSFAIAAGNYWVFFNADAATSMLKWTSNLGVLSSPGLSGFPAAQIAGPGDWGGCLTQLVAYTATPPTNNTVVTPYATALASPVFFQLS